jgi:creatinine amidohydrolase
MMVEWYELAEMTSTEFAEARATIRLALVPVGATEQHGPNLALGTDYVIAHRLCQRIAAGMHPRAVVLPPVPLGLSYHHTGFAGTLSLSPETLTAVCIDIARSLKQQGIGHVVFVNGHNGNTAVLNVAATRIRYDLDMRAAVAFWFQQAGDLVRKHARTDRYGHACEIETSVLMALAGDMVREDQLEAGDMKPARLQHAFNNQPFFHTVPVPFHEQTRNGVFGDARLASREAGDEIVAAAVERTLAFIETFLADETN